MSFTITSTNTDVVPSTEVTYTCEFGYQLPAGDLGTRVCQLGGTWPAPPPACEAPGINEFTITSTNTDVVPSTEVTYTCDFGYQLPAGDLGTRICQLGGTWPAPPPACEVIKCAAPGLNEFTITSTNTDVVPSTEVTYTCEFGYQLPAGDLGTRICQLGGTWPAPPPPCEVVKCTAPEINEFTITSTNTDVVPSAEVTYTCEFGYQLPAGDLGTRICQLGGTWPAPPPACEAGDLGTRICQLGGTWPAPPPACEGKNFSSSFEVIKCAAPGINEFTITSTNTDVVPSTEVTYTCEFGYQLPAGDLGTRICQLGGTWPAPPPACEDIDECATAVCQNGATCNDLVNGYTCTCATGYTDTHCETDTDNCVGNDCENGATCVDGLSSYTCNCAEDFEGDFCETQFCTGKAAGSYANPEDCTSYYICRDDFTGALLEYCMEGENWDDTSKRCDSNAPCDSEDVGDADVRNSCYGVDCNGGTCVVDSQDATQYTCQCADGATGDHCEDMGLLDVFDPDVSIWFVK
ncbi:unnamed protein product [Mytilus edulis]|uniref:Uncharacterized protein n=1 Tax=Mytilus edulis TaxID=6550 RepID=A0A8S3UM95_MYTED|nr:unnamed protein product [Mytilus edulis]